MSSRLNRETEIKLKVADRAAARRLLVGHSFRVLKARVFERNTVYDGAGLPLRRQGMLLRIRRAGRVSTLTFKGVARPGKHKSREELETQVSDAVLCEMILARLGFQPVFRYEKYRTEFAQTRSPGVVTLDETPIGVFLELEGPAAWIDRLARRLGFTEEDYITASYGSLYLEHLRKNRQAPADMVFPTS